MLRPMKGFEGLGVDTMAMPDGPDTPVPSFNPLTVSPSWSMFDSVPGAAFVSDNPRMTQLPNNNQSVSFASADKSAAASNSGSASGGGIFDWLQSKLGPAPVTGGSASGGGGATSQVPATFRTTRQVPAVFNTNTAKGGGGGSSPGFLDILKGITGALPAITNAYIATTNPPPPAGFLRDPRTGKLVPIQAPQFTSNGGSTPISGGTPWGTYALIGGGVVLAGVAVFALTSGKKRKSRRR